MKLLRDRLGVIGTAIAGLVLGVWVAVLAWDRVVPPPRCDGAGLPGGRFVHPLCVSAGPPVWLTLGAAVLGIALGLIVYFGARSIRVDP